MVASFLGDYELRELNTGRGNIRELLPGFDVKEFEDVLRVDEDGLVKFELRMELLVSSGGK